VTTAGPAPWDAPLLSAFRSLWPEATVAEGGRGSYALVPSARSPRLVVPVGSRRAAGRALCRFSVDSSATQVVRRGEIGSAA